MTMHRIYMPDLPGGYTMCLCVRGHDHDEADFDVPLGQHGELIDYDGPDGHESWSADVPTSSDASTGGAS